MSSTLYKKIWREAARRLIKQEGPGGFPPGPRPEKTDLGLPEKAISATNRAYAVPDSP